MRQSFLLLACALSVHAQTGRSACRDLFEPKTYQDAVASAPNLRYDLSATIWGEPRQIPAIRIRLIDGTTELPLHYRSITISYAWQWLEYAYPEHPFGAWSNSADRITCDLDSNGWIEVPSQLVEPRGWYDGKYTRFPWLRKPSFTNIGIVAVTSDGLFANATIARRDLDRVTVDDAIVRVFDGYRTLLSWRVKPERAK